jgi:4-hydroxybenzoyl-CoA reductase subunit beta
MMNSTQMHLASPASLDEALGLILSSESAQLMAGGTDLVPLVKKGLKSPSLLVDISRIDDLNVVEERPGGLFIGAMTGLAELANNAGIGERLPSLAAAAAMVASPQIRTSGTLGGNLCQDRRCMYFNQTAFWRQSIKPCFKTGGSVCHQKPSSSACLATYHSDLAPVLLALEAKACGIDEQGAYELPMAEFISGHSLRNGGVEPGKSILTGVLIPFAASNQWCRFVRHSARTAIDFALVNAALAWRPGDGNETKAKARFFVGAAAPQPIEMQETQTLLEAGPAAQTDWKQACIQCAENEFRQKNQLILDTGSSMQARKAGGGLIGRLAGELAEYIGSQS